MDGRGEALDEVAAEVEFLTEEQAGGLLSQPSKVAQGGTYSAVQATKASEQSRVWT